MNRLLKLNIGCGLSAPEGWVNIDSSFNARLSKYPRVKRLLGMFRVLPKKTLEIPWPLNIRILDVRKALPYPDNSVRYVYSSHMLEHLSRNEAHLLLRECYRVLVPGGIIRLIVPDLFTAVTQYIEAFQKGEVGSQEMLPAEIFLKKLDLLEIYEKNDNIFVRFYRTIYNKNLHKWAYDEQSLTYFLMSIGFKDVRKKECGDSLMEKIKELDNPLRFKESICIEAVKEDIGNQ